MAEVVVCKHTFAIVTGAGIPYEIDHSMGEIRERSLLRCVYLTRSITAAVELQMVAKCISLRVHQASDLREALLLLRVTGAHVVLVDLPFLHQDLPAVLGALERACPQAAVVVVAPEKDADRWEDVLRLGGFDMVLRPFWREELAEVLDAANEYAVQHRTPEAIARRLAKLYSFLRDLIANPRSVNHSP